MKISEIDLVGKPTPSPEEIIARHKMDSADFYSQLDKGISVEKEHTDNEAEAREIALDHLYELPDYYTRLERMERS